MESFKLHYPLVASVILIAMIVLAHLVSSSQYQWTSHTISHLGAQTYERKWIMQIGFMAFGIVLAIGILLHGIEWRTVPFLIYGLCVGLSGIFCSEPFIDGIPYDVQVANLHSWCAQVAGISFSLGILLQIFFTTEVKLKWIHLVFFVMVVGISALFGLLKSGQGIAQRLLYLVSLYWLSYWYEV